MVPKNKTQRIVNAEIMESIGENTDAQMDALVSLVGFAEKEMERSRTRKCR